MTIVRPVALLALLLTLSSGCLGVIAYGRTPYELNGKTYHLQVERSDDGDLFTVWSRDGLVERRQGEPGPLAKRLETEGRKTGPTRTVTTAYENVYDDFDGGGD